MSTEFTKYILFDTKEKKACATFYVSGDAPRSSIERAIKTAARTILVDKLKEDPDIFVPSYDECKKPSVMDTYCAWSQMPSEKDLETLLLKSISEMIGFGYRVIYQNPQGKIIQNGSPVMSENEINDIIVSNALRNGTSISLREITDVRNLVTQREDTIAYLIENAYAKMLLCGYYEMYLSDRDSAYAVGSIINRLALGAKMLNHFIDDEELAHFSSMEWDNIDLNSIRTYRQVIRCYFRHRIRLLAMLWYNGDEYDVHQFGRLPESRITDSLSHVKNLFADLLGILGIDELHRSALLLTETKRPHPERRIMDSIRGLSIYEFCPSDSEKDKIRMMENVRGFHGIDMYIPMAYMNYVYTMLDKKIHDVFDAWRHNINSDNLFDYAKDGGADNDAFKIDYAIGTPLDYTDTYIEYKEMQLEELLSMTDQFTDISPESYSYFTKSTKEELVMQPDGKPEFSNEDPYEENPIKNMDPESQILMILQKLQKDRAEKLSR